MAVKCMYNARIHLGVTNRARLSGSGRGPASDHAGIKRDHRLSRLAFTVLFLLYAQHYSPSDLLVPPAVVYFFVFFFSVFASRSLLRSRRRALCGVLVSWKNAINGGANLICIEIDKNKDVMMEWMGREKNGPRAKVHIVSRIKSIASRTASRHWVVKWFNFTIVNGRATKMRRALQTPWWRWVVLAGPLLSAGLVAFNHLLNYPRALGFGSGFSSF